MREPITQGLGEGECYCQPDIGWVCHHHENAPVPHSPKRDAQAIETVLRLQHRETGRALGSCKCVECRAIVRVAVMARERIAMGGGRRSKRRHHAALREALRIADELTVRHGESEQTARLRELLRSVYGAQDSLAGASVLAVDPARSTPTAIAGSPCTAPSSAPLPP